MTLPTIPATLAFIFTRDLSEVLLMQKEKPVHHAGMLNGLGGKLEAGESHLECIVREIEEEAGLKIPSNKWLSVGEMVWQSWQVTIWTSVIDDPKPTAFPEQLIGWYPTNSLPKNIIENLTWLVPLSIDVNRQATSQEKSNLFAKISYN